MEKIYLSLTFLLLFLTQSGLAQHPEHPGWAPNLVPNPGFEKLNGQVNTRLEAYLQFRLQMLGWNSPSRTTPDLIYAKDPVSVDTEEDYGYDLPRRGRCAVAIITDNPQVSETRTDTYREYIQIKLKKPLRAGERYHVSFWVKKAREANLVSNNLGVAFDFLPVRKQDYEMLNHQPVFNAEQVVNAEKAQWVRMESEFEAQQDYTHMILGNFFGREETLVQDFGQGEWHNAYYIIDDVNLYQLTNIQPENKPEPELVAKGGLENIEVKAGAVIELQNIFFETAKWDLLPESHHELRELLNLMDKYPTLEIAIHGHTDSRGGVSYNQNLSENRAKAVYEYLLQNSIEQFRINFAGFGLAKPVETNETPEGRQKNRRVEFVILKE